MAGIIPPILLVPAISCLPEHVNPDQRLVFRFQTTRNVWRESRRANRDTSPVEHSFKFERPIITVAVFLTDVLNHLAVYAHQSDYRV